MFICNELSTNEVDWLFDMSSKEIVYSIKPIILVVTNWGVLRAIRFELEIHNPN